MVTQVVNLPRGEALLTEEVSGSTVTQVVNQLRSETDGQSIVSLGRAIERYWKTVCHSARMG